MDENTHGLTKVIVVRSTRSMKHVVHGLVVLLPLFSFSACSHFLPLEPGSQAGGSQASGAAAPGTDSCEGRALIEDAEDGDAQSLTRQGRGGYLYTYTDDNGSRVSPASSAFKVTAGGPPGSRHALQMKGKTADGGDVYAGMGFSFVDPKGPYDASEYKGIAFVAKRGAGGPTKVRFKLPDASTDPKGGSCEECYNDFGVDFDLNEEWTRYVVMFENLKQESGWGRPRPEQVDAKRLYGVQWQVSAGSSEFDVWIDDVTFVGCENKD